MTKSPILAVLALGFTAVSFSCTSSGSTPSATGGTASGGTPGQGGATATGGVTASGGQVATGGSQATGGAISTGGVGTGGSTGGSSGGATSSGGAVATGGQAGGSATGGKSGTDAGTGGTAATGGSAGGTGGTGTGGAGTGGTTGAGGSAAGTPSKGCGKTPTLTSGSKTLSGRSYIIRIPSTYDNNHPYRLVFAFHWNGGTMADIDGGGSSGAVWSYYGLQAQANNTTIFVAPQGNGNGWANPGGADLKFVDDMVALFEDDLCIDTSRIFAMGFSYGGGMSYSIACSRAKVFRAVAVYSGAQLSGCDGGKDPIAYLGIHGISDGTCNIGGGRSLRDTFVKNNGCTAQSPPEPSAGSATHKCTTYEGCKSGYPVEWCAFDGGHTPGMVDGGGDDGAKTWTKTEAWKFFSQF